MLIAHKIALAPNNKQGTEHDRDLNARINLRNYAVSSTVPACGGEGAGLGVTAKVKPAPAKQEASTKATYGYLWVDLGRSNATDYTCRFSRPK